MLTHEQILKAMFVRNEAGQIIDFDAAKLQGVVVMTKQSVNMEYYNLLRASATMYQTIETQIEAFSKLIEFCESLGADGLVPTLLDMQLALHITKRVAVEGVEIVSQGLPNNKN